jgi:hypothetical protein
MFRFYSTIAFALTGFLYLLTALPNHMPPDQALMRLAADYWRDVHVQNHWTLAQVATLAAANQMLAVWTTKRAMLPLYASLVIAGFAMFYTGDSGYAMRRFVDDQTSLLADMQNHFGPDQMGVGNLINSIAAALP